MIKDRHSNGRRDTMQTLWSKSDKYVLTSYFTQYKRIICVVSKLRIQRQICNIIFHEVHWLLSKI